jgi:hypothetical protein
MVIIIIIIHRATNGGGADYDFVIHILFFFWTAIHNHFTIFHVN